MKKNEEANVAKIEQETLLETPIETNEVLTSETIADESVVNDTEQTNVGKKKKSQNAFRDKLWSTTKRYSRRWFIDAFSGMAQGLFVTLIAGTIFKQIGSLFGESGFAKILILIGNFACTLMGAGIGVGIAKYLKASNLVMLGCAVAGLVGAFLPDLAYKAIISDGGFSLTSVANSMTSLKLGLPGNPIGSYVATLVALEVVKLFAGKTKLDILLVPLAILSLSFITMFLAIPAIWLIAVIGKFIEISTEAVPFIMGVVISVVMGILLTMPTSSAAIWIALAASNSSDTMLLAGGAAVVGCACQMVGFAVMSYKENRVSGLISQGLGTSMLQIPNIMKNPKIFIPPIVASAICGPLATCVFKLRCNATGGGMGTAGLVGVFGTVEASTGVVPLWSIITGIILLMFVLPAIISWGVGLLLRKSGWIKEGDLSLNYDN